MRPALDSAGHRVPRTKPTCLLHTWRPHRRRPFMLVLHLHQHLSSRNLHLQYLAKNQSTQRCQSLITQGSDHPTVLEPHMVLKLRVEDPLGARKGGPNQHWKWARPAGLGQVGLGPSRPAWADRPRPIPARFGRPFAPVGPYVFMHFAPPFALF
jgi:hypothetical protein